MTRFLRKKGAFFDFVVHCSKIFYHVKHHPDLNDLFEEIP
jgi:hypothetical protein